MWLIVEGRVGSGHSVTLRKVISSLLVELSEKGTLGSFYGPRTYSRGTRFLVAVRGAEERCVPALDRSLREVVSGCTGVDELAFYYAGRAVGDEL